MDEIETKSASAVAAILGGAGWKADPGWGGFTHGTCVGGLAPDGNVYVKNWAAIGPDHPKYSADTPDTAEEAAQWLADRYKANPLETEVTLDPVALQSEEVENPGDESNGETGEETSASARAEAQSEAVSEDWIEGGFDGPVVSDAELGSDDAEGIGGLPEPILGEPSNLPLDTDFTEGQDLGSELLDTILEGGDPWALPSPEPEDFAPDEIVPPETQSGAFIFGDNLDQLRTAAIGRVIRYANALMPHWAIQDDARLAYLRNFAMGVSEKRWDDDPALSAELNALETTIRRINEIKNSRDAKVEFLESASREEIIDFAVEANWP